MVNNMNISFAETQDIKGRKCGPKLYMKCSRDPARTPMQWTSRKPQAGFTTSSSPWLPVNQDYKDGINFEDEALGMPGNSYFELDGSK